MSTLNRFEWIKDKVSKEELLGASIGIEREALRVTREGKLSRTLHPTAFKDKMKNPYITTDFSESQVELITPNFNRIDETYDFLNALYDMTVLNIGEEVLWPQSNPCDIPEDDEIPIARYSDCSKCKQARIYREELLKKYGGKKQLISGIHYNFSFEEELISNLYHLSHSALNYQLFKNEVYLKVTREYLTYRWLIIYLLGATPIFHKSFALECTKLKDKIGEDSFSNEGAVSYRNGECGYRNSEDLYPSYTSVETYIKSIESFIEQGKIQSYKELYSQIRPKAKDNTNLLESLQEDGIKYIEVRSIDTNPFEKGGISKQDLEFLELFMLYLLLKEETKYTEANWQGEATYNQRLVAKEGLLDIRLRKDGKEVSKRSWALEILNEIKLMNEVLHLDRKECIQEMFNKIENPEVTYAARIKTLCKEKGYLGAHLELADTYKEEAYNNRYKLYGYEDLELSTQILMKQAILEGISVEVLDRADNFIALSQGEHIEYVKQATKTSKDSYMTMLIMENKVVTKKVLERHGIYVPQGIELVKGQTIEKAIKAYENKAIVIKPKSTNFGLGISIFKESASKQDIKKAIEIAFNYDNTILIENFAKGKEYRFLVIGEEVVGILHRVPANVIGDGIHSIRELVALKNKDSLRGTGYKTPLEKIKLDASSELFLKQNNYTFDTVPNTQEIVYLRENSNISTGGDSIDYTDSIPVRFKEIAVKAAKAAGARFCGVDMMLEDYRDENTAYAIIEINFNPAIHIHCYPYKGKERNIASKVLKELGFN